MIFNTNFFIYAPTIYLSQESHPTCEDKKDFSKPQKFQNTNSPLTSSSSDKEEVAQILQRMPMLYKSFPSSHPLVRYPVIEALELKQFQKTCKKILKIVNRNIPTYFYTLKPNKTADAVPRSLYSHEWKRYLDARLHPSNSEWGKFSDQFTREFNKERSKNNQLTVHPLRNMDIRYFDRVRLNLHTAKKNKNR